MKQIVQFKRSNTIQLSHLYEHIFCAQADELFYANGLFSYLDYKLTGRAYQRGIVYISIQLYTAEAEKLAFRIFNTKLSLNRGVISTALSQLIAEKEYAFDGQGYDVVKRALEELDSQSWQNLDQIAIVDTEGMRRKAQPLYINEDSPLPAHKLTVNISVDLNFITANRHLLPLFRQLALLMSNTLQNVLADKYGYYSAFDEYKNDKQMVGMSNIFKVPDGGDVNVEDCLTTCVGMVNNLQRHDAFARLAEELRHATLYHQPHHVPSPEDNFVDTGVLIGAEGWKQTATLENSETLLRNMTVEIKYGRKKLTRPIRS